MDDIDRLYVGYDPLLLGWQLGEDHPTNPIRAKIAVQALRRMLGKRMLARAVAQGVDVTAELRVVHHQNHIQRTRDGWSQEWGGQQKKLGKVAEHMFRHTVVAARRIMAGQSRVAFVPQGAKHHAQWNQGSGFCVYNDFAWAAKEFAARGERVLYVDLDAHHGDGVEALCQQNDAVRTVSIHDGTIFPAPRSGLWSRPEFEVFNVPLPRGGTGEMMLAALGDQLEMSLERFKPTMLLVAIGADAHRTDPLSSLQYDYQHYAVAAEMLADFSRAHCGGRMLMGGAGGYQPETHTPLVWATFVATVAKSLLTDEKDLEEGGVQAGVS